MEYPKNYLQSPHWQKIRQTKLSSRPFCQICNSETTLNVHHRYYIDKETGESILYNEKTTGLYVMCFSCHMMWHKYCQGKIDKKGRLKTNKKILMIKALMNYGATKPWAFRIVGLDLAGSIWGKVKEFSKENNYGQIH